MKTIHQKILLFLLLLSMTLCPLSGAGVSEKPSETRVVVTANRYKTNTKKLPVRIKILSKKEIKDSAALSLSELLNRKLPFYIKESPGETGTVWIRGAKSDDSGSFVSSRVLVLLNGHPAGTGIVDTIPLSAIERIEVIAGPFSVTYGSGALAGVVNIITLKKFTPGIKIHLETGSYDLANVWVQGSFSPDPKLNFSFSGGINERKDYSIGSSSSKELKYNSTSRSKYKNTAYKKNHSYLGLQYNFSQKTVLKASALYNNLKKAGTPNSFFSNDENDYTDGYHFSSDIALYSQFSSLLNFKSTAYFIQSKKNNYGLAPSAEFWFTQKLIESGLNANIQVKSASFAITAGINLDYLTLEKDGSGYAEPKSSYLSGGAFSELHLAVVNTLDFWIGGRLDSYTASLQSGDTSSLNNDKETKSFYRPSFRGGISWNYKGWSAKLHSGTGFTAPSVMQLTGKYEGPWGASGTKTFQGNPNLKPESSFSVESSFGYDKRHTLMFSYGYQEVYNRITMDNSVDPASYKNLKKVIFQFIELEGSLNWGMLLKIPSLYGKLGFKSLHYLEYTDTETGSKLIQAYIPEDKAVFFFNMGYYKLFNLTADYTMMGTLIDGASFRDIGHFHLMNIRIETTPFNFWNYKRYKGLSLFFAIQNILDSEYEYVDGYPLPGRNIRFGMEYKYLF